MGDGAIGDWRREVLDAVMVWTVRLGGVLALALFMEVTRYTPGSLREPGLLVVYGSYAALVLLRYRPSLGYYPRALSFCSLIFGLGASSLYSLGVRPGPTLTCAFAVIASRLFLGRYAMLVALLLTTVAISLAGVSAPAGAGGDAVWLWLRAGAAFAMPSASIAVLVAHVVGKIERSLVDTTDALSRLSTTEAARAS